MSACSLPNIESSPKPLFASRMLLSSICVNRLSNWRAASFSAVGACAFASFFKAARPWKSAKNEMLVGAVIVTSAQSPFTSSNDDQLGAQRTGFFEPFENRHEVAGRGAHLVHRAYDLVEIDARL